MSERDYTKYSLDDLYDAAQHLDADLYPERAEQINSEIKSRVNDGLSPDSNSVIIDRPKARFIPKHVIGLYLFTSGVICLSLSIDFRPMAHGVKVWVPYLVVAVVYGGMILAGICLIKGWRVGLWISTVLLYLQVPIIQISHVTYTITGYPTLEWKLWPRFGFAFAMGNQVTLFWHPTPQQFYLGFNLAPVLVLTYLIHYLKRQQEAIVRLERRHERKAG